tara:strand:- start:1749 stop:2051 length:303 start_codon:yes stop_codon:yes gene_type:complete
MPKIKKNAFFYPSQPANTSSSSPSDQANDYISKQDRRNNSLINITEGKYDTVENFNTDVELDSIHYHTDKTSYYQYTDLQISPTVYNANMSLHRPGNNSK